MLNSGEQRLSERLVVDLRSLTVAESAAMVTLGDWCGGESKEGNRQWGKVNKC